MTYTKAYIVSPGRYVLLANALGHSDLFSVMRNKPYKLQPTVGGNGKVWNIALKTGSWKSSFTVAELIKEAKVDPIDLTAIKPHEMTFSAIRKLIDAGIIDKQPLKQATKATAPQQSQQQLKCWIIGSLRKDGTLLFHANPEQHTSKQSAQAAAERLAALPDANGRTMLVFETVFGAVKTNVSTFEL